MGINIGQIFGKLKQDVGLAQPAPLPQIQPHIASQLGVSSSPSPQGAIGVPMQHQINPQILQQNPQLAPGLNQQAPQVGVTGYNLQSLAHPQINTNQAQIFSAQQTDFNNLSHAQRMQQLGLNDWQKRW